MQALEQRFGYKEDPLSVGQETQDKQDFLKIGRDSFGVSLSL